MSTSNAATASTAVAGHVPMAEDLGPLAWVHSEIQKSLENVGKSLRRFARDVAATPEIDAAPLRLARQHLHQAVGALQMVGHPAPALVLGAMEFAVQNFITQPQRCTEAAVEKIERAGFAVADFLNAMLSGKTLSSVALFPQYRDVLELIGNERVHPADLWNLSWRWVEITPAPTQTALVYDPAVRSKLDREVLKVVKSGDDHAARRLQGLCLGLGRGAATPRVASFWTLAAAFFEAISLHLIPADSHVKRAASRVLLQYATLARGDNTVSDRLGQDLLFFCAQAVPGTRDDAVTLRAVRAAWGISHEQQVDYAIAQFGRFDPSALTLARKRIESAKEMWTALSGGDVSRARQVADAFAQLGESLLKLHSPSAPLVNALNSAVDASMRTAKAPSTELAMEVATSILYLEAAFQDLDPQDRQLTARTIQLAGRIDRVRDGGRSEPLEPWMEELYRRVSDRQTMGTVVGELRSHLAELEKSLDQFFRRPGDKAVLRSVPTQLLQMRGVFSVLGLDQATLAAQRMREGVDRLIADATPESDAHEFESLGNNLGALGFLIDMLGYQPALAKRLFVFDEEEGELKPLMGRHTTESVQDLAAAAPNYEVDVDLDQLEALPELSATPETQVVPPPAQPVQESIPAPAPVAEPYGALSADEVDAQIAAKLAALATPGRKAVPPIEETRREPASWTAKITGPAPLEGLPDTEVTELEEDDLQNIFLDEAREVLHNGLAAVAALGRQKDDASELTVLRRAFHTLKGSARMVGLMEFGDAAWSFEQVLNTWLADQRPATPDLLSGTGQALKDFAKWVEAIAASEPHNWQSAPFKLVAESLHSGQAIATSIPAVDTDTLEAAARQIAAQEEEEAAKAEAMPVADAQPRPLPLALPELPDLDFLSEDKAGEEASTEASNRWSAKDADGTASETAPHAEDARPGLPEADDDFASTDFLDFEGHPSREPQEAEAAHPLGGFEDIDFLETAQAAIEPAPPSERPAPAMRSEAETEAVAESREAEDAEAEARDAQELARLLDAESQARDALGKSASQAPTEPVPHEVASASVKDEAPSLIDDALLQREDASAFHAAAGAEKSESVEATEQPDVAASPEAAQALRATHEIDAAAEAEVEADPEHDDGSRVSADAGAVADAAPAQESSKADDDAIAPVEDVEPVERIASTEGDANDQVKVIGPLRIGIALYNVYLVEADEWSRQLQHQLDEWALETHERVPDSAVGLAHSLAGSSATVGFQGLSGMARLIESALQHLHVQGSGSAAQGVVLVAAAEEVRRLLHQFAAGFLKDPSEKTLQALREIVESPMPSGVEVIDAIELDASADDSLEAEALTEALADVPPQAAREVPSPTPLDAPLAFVPPARSADVSLDDSDEGFDVHDAVDADLFPIFEEEAAELLPQLGSALREWTLAPHDSKPSASALRTLHTLKGSARLAGAMRLGERAHRMESEIEAIGLDGATAASVEQLLARFDALQEAFDVLRAADAASATATAAESAPSADATTRFAQPEPAVIVPPAVDAAAPSAVAEAAAASAASSSATSPPAASKVALPLPSALAPLRSTSNQAVRIRTQLLDRLMAQAGEIIITRSRLENELGQLRGSLADLTGNLERLRQQLRDIEVQAESQMQSRLAQAKDSKQGFDPLEFDRFTRVQELTRMMAESVNDVATVQRTLQKTVQATEDDLSSQARQTRELQRGLLRTRMVEFDGISERLYRVVRQASKDTGKQVRLDIDGGTIEMDRGVLDRMTPSFEHLLRNAIAHGIEDPATRERAGKEPSGLITIALSHEGNDVAVSFRDDGAGLDYQRIAERALSLGLADPEQPLSDDDLAGMIFRPGFSTAQEVSEIAGRGIGMDVVRAHVAALGGRVETRSRTGQGTTFRLVLPLTTAVTHVVMIRTGSTSIGVPSNLVEVVLRAGAADLEKSYESHDYDFAGERVPFFWAGALLQSSARSERAPGRANTVVIVRSAAQRIALHVDEVLGNQEVVVKNLGPQLSRLPGMAGISVLASGAVALIYNPVALAAVHGDKARAMQSASQAGAPQAAGEGGDASEAQAVPVAPLVLVVDDSITVRRVTQRLLQREGFRVALAADGLQALERLQQERPAVVLSDIEMPRMDGFDLVRNIRADAALAEMPIIMITSRIAEKHRDHAKALGVNHYLGKPYSEDELLRLVRSFTHVEVADALVA